jgi:hypothetical protein
MGQIVTNTVDFSALTPDDYPFVNCFIIGLDTDFLLKKMDSNGVVTIIGDCSINEQSIVTSATVTPTIINDIVVITAQTTAVLFANPTGTPVQGQVILVRIKDDGTARAITFDTQYRAVGVLLPTTTIAGKITYFSMIYNSTDTKWDVVQIQTEA